MMSKKCKYALKALTVLASNNGAKMRSADIATQGHIPKKFLEHILIDLKSSGFVASKQGNEGGYFLLKQPEIIKVSEIHRIFDGAIALLPCVSEKFYQPCEDCPDPMSCKMKHVFTDIRNKTYDLLSNTTIKDLV
jgi:Rrf2 family protein